MSQEFLTTSLSHHSYRSQRPWLYWGLHKERSLKPCDLSIVYLSNICTDRNECLTGVCFDILIKLSGSVTSTLAVSSFFFRLSWCFTSTETVWLIRDGGRMG